MGRFLLGVLFAFGLWWGYDRFLGSAADAAGHAGAGPPAIGGANLRDLDSGVDGGGEVPPRTAPVPRDEDGGAAGEGGDVIQDDPLAAEQPASFAGLRLLRGAERDRLAATLIRAVREAASPQSAVAELGRTNDFLHVAEGRQLLDEVLTRIERLPAQEAVAVTSQLLELAANGSIERPDVEARTAFEGIAKRHGRLVDRTLFDPSDTTSARRYEVQSGDNLVGIARHLRKTLGVKVEAGTLQVVNRISNPRGLGVGQVLKCPVEPIRTVVYKRSYVVAVYVGDVVVRTYWCAHGKVGDGGRGHETPEATFTIGEKIENPDWHYEGRIIPFGDPENPLGTRFVRFDHPSYTGFGIHGTNAPESIGTMASLGCIRLAQDDIVEFCDLVPRGTEVVIRM